MRHRMQPGVLLCVGVAILLTLSFGTPVNATKQISDEAQIRAVLDMQSAAWNRGDVDTFMTGYWKSEETEFVGASGITRGWQAVLDRYRRNYPDAKAMGRLTFSNLEVHVVCRDSAFVIGEFKLEREKDQPSGVFTLNFRKFTEGWRIVADHTTGYPAPAPTASL
jgi:ketosteroid isomerase-like protein